MRKNIFQFILPILPLFLLINFLITPALASSFDLNDKTANGNNLTNHSATENITNTPFGQSAYAVNLSGSGQYLTAASSSSFKQTGNFTVEAWFKTSSANYQHLVTVFDQNSPNIYGYDIFIDNIGKINFEIGKNTGSNQGTDAKIVKTSNAWNDGGWHHMAAVYNGSTMEIFIDGVSDGSVSWSNNAVYPSTIYPVIGASGNQPTPNENWNGSLDEVRIWSTARTSAQINANKNVELTGSESGLVVYYPLESVLTAPTPSFTVSDKTGHGNDMTNHSATNTSSTPFGQSAFALNLSGSNQYLTAASSNDFKQTGNFTVEAWFKTSSASYQHIVTVYDQNVYATTIYGYDIFIDNAGKINFEIGKNTGPNQGTDAKVLVGSNSWKDGNWHHLAAVYNGSTMQIFIDGVSDGSVSWSGNAGYPSTIYPVIGAGANQPTPVEYWNGSLDEVRIWSTARTSAQINADKDIELTGAEPGLAVYYPFESLIPDITYFTKNDGTDFSRSTFPFSSGVVTQARNPNGSLTVNINSSSGYADSGFAIYQGTLGNLPDFTVDGAGDDFGLNIWFDTGNNNDYFAWNGSNILTSLDSDTYALGPGSSGGTTSVTGSTQFYLMSDGQNHSLSDLKNGNVSGISSSTKVAVWVGVNTSSGSKSSTINSISGL